VAILQSAVRWRVVLRSAAWGFVVLVCAAVLSTYVVIALSRPEDLFQDTRLYFEATRAWLAGYDPWAVSNNGITFAGIPPTLLLNLPLQPLGPEAAYVFWPTAGLVGLLIALRRFGLSPFWLLWPPVIEGWSAGSPDYALLGLMVIGGGAIAGVAKPYTVPALLAQGRWRAVAVAAGIGLVTLPLLPWATFLAERDAILDVLAEQAWNLSGWGSPLLMIATAIALLSLRAQGLELATPGLWPHSQMHYAVFSIRAAARSPILALGFAVPISGAPAWAIIAYAAFELLRGPADAIGLRLKPGRREGVGRPNRDVA
jgi:hypothetical protein